MMQRFSKGAGKQEVGKQEAGKQEAGKQEVCKQEVDADCKVSSLQHSWYKCLIF